MATQLDKSDWAPILGPSNPVTEIVLDTDPGPESEGTHSLQVPVGQIPSGNPPWALAAQPPEAQNLQTCIEGWFKMVPDPGAYSGEALMIAALYARTSESGAAVFQIIHAAEALQQKINSQPITAGGLFQSVLVLDSGGAFETPWDIFLPLSLEDIPLTTDWTQLRLFVDDTGPNVTRIRAEARQATTDPWKLLMDFEVVDEPITGLLGPNAMGAGAFGPSILGGEAVRIDTVRITQSPLPALPDPFEFSFGFEDASWRESFVSGGFGRLVTAPVTQLVPGTRPGGSGSQVLRFSNDDGLFTEIWQHPIATTAAISRQIEFWARPETPVTQDLAFVRASARIDGMSSGIGISTLLSFNKTDGVIDPTVNLAFEGQSTTVSLDSGQTFSGSANQAIVPGRLMIRVPTFSASDNQRRVVVDDGDGLLVQRDGTGESVTGTVDYITGAITVTFNAPGVTISGPLTVYFVPQNIGNPAQVQDVSSEVLAVDTLQASLGHTWSQGAWYGLRYSVQDTIVGLENGLLFRAEVFLPGASSWADIAVLTLATQDSAESMPVGTWLHGYLGRSEFGGISPGAGVEFDDVVVREFS